MPDTSAPAVCPCLIDGEWTESTATETTDVWNPSSGAVIARTPLGGADDVNRAVAAAMKAFPAWSDTPAPERARLMFRFHRLLVEHADDIAAIISTEHGKTRLEARASVQRGIEMVEFACGIPSLLAGEIVENIAPDIDCETVRHPLGVVAGITPFNFPAMVPLWMFPVALVCGNCFVLKPSERVPLSAQRIVELLIEAGLPRGVLSIVHGGQSCVDALLTHKDIRAISFVGSTRVAEHVYTTGTAHGKRVQANGGAKNHLIIMPDARLDTTVASLINSAFGCAGERCMAGSLAIPVGGIGDDLVGTLVEKAAGMKVGRTDHGQDVNMGPLITRRHQENVRRAIDDAESDGATIALDGRRLNSPDTADGFFVGPTVVDRVQPDHRIAREEVFGPVLSVARVDSLDEAIALGRQCPYGNGAVIYTTSGHAAREFKHRFNAGMIGINVGVPAPMAWFPFTGWNASFFGDLHIQGKEGVLFYTQQRMIMTRWFEDEPQKRRGTSAEGPAASWR